MCLDSWAWTNSPRREAEMACSNCQSSMKFPSPPPAQLTNCFRALTDLCSLLKPKITHWAVFRWINSARQRTDLCPNLLFLHLNFHCGCVSSEFCCLLKIVGTPAHFPYPWTHSFCPPLSTSYWFDLDPPLSVTLSWLAADRPLLLLVFALYCFPYKK